MNFCSGFFVGELGDSTGVDDDNIRVFIGDEVSHFLESFLNPFGVNEVHFAAECFDKNTHESIFLWRRIN